MTIARFDSDCPAPNSWVTTPGSWPAGVTRTYPAAVGPETWVFTTTAVALLGTPPLPASDTFVGEVPTVPPNTREAFSGV